MVFTADRQLPFVILCLGSNLGDSVSIIQAAVTTISELVNVKQVTPIIETAAVDMPNNTPNFHNCLLLGSTNLQPEALLSACMAIEAKFGRKRTDNTTHENRTLDIDILNYECVIWHSPTLVLPHTVGLQREFVKHLLNQLKTN